MTGTAPCGKCRKVIDNIPLDASSKESDGDGGYWYMVLGNAKCLNCGEPLNWFHQPSGINLAKEIFADVVSEYQLLQNEDEKE